MTIYIGSDHAGYELKKFLISTLESAQYHFEDCGPETSDSCDYPIFAAKVCEKILETKTCGILICGTGIGMSMAANRRTGIRAALCGTELQARMSRKHNNANILCLGSRIIGAELARAIVEAYLGSSFEGGRHQRRIDLFD